MQAAVVGASGYVGGELLRLLVGHPHLEAGPLMASTGGRTVGDVHPQLAPLAEQPIVPADARVAAEADVVLLALPHGESAGFAAELAEHGAPLVLDLGADHRLRSSADWEQWYGHAHPQPDQLGRWPYGLPELPGVRQALRGAQRIAVPGCYPTAVVLGLAPLLAAGLVEPADVVVVAASGTSGAGRTASVALLASQVMGDVSAYKVGAHQHTPEIEQALTAAAGAPVRISLTTLLVPMPRGILATSTARLAVEASADDLRAALAAAYADEPFVHVLPAGQWPHTSSTLGSNACHLQVHADHRSGRAVVVAAIDNLGKGAAGQALQCANVALGLLETAGLAAVGVAP